MGHSVAATHNHHADTDALDVFGFWLYIMTDCILFGCLFATFIVLNFQGMRPAVTPHFNLNTVLVETFLLLASNFTFCLAMLSMYQNKLANVQAWLLMTLVLGLGFIFLEVSEFIAFA